VIALGMSGRVYESEISSTSLNKFEEVKELAYSTVADISGTFDFCFVVLKDGRVFGRGENSNCKLGLPKQTKSISKFTLIEPLNKYKIVSVFIFLSLFLFIFLFLYSSFSLSFFFFIHLFFFLCPPLLIIDNCSNYLLIILIFYSLLSFFIHHSHPISILTTFAHIL
ncbi:RCC1-like domain-containing protein, partial [Helicobacter typhlonius]|uniref:RCC1-like domain-containing protein n=1 Tax=Helicobacter typhlonius TaxID=76936 RepID=UPI002FDF2351